jgi:glycosyltransferase involved in cell wall biosynthesis
MESRVIGRADAVLFTSPETVDFTMQRYPGSWGKKAFYIPHCYDPADYDGDIVPAEDRYVIRFVGSLYGRRSPKPLIEAIESIARETPRLLENVSVDFVGADEHEGLLKDYPAAQQIIHHLGWASHSESRRMMQSAHCLVVIDAPSDLSVFFPSKLVEYIGAKRFILALSPPGASARIVEALGGIVANPADIRSVVEALRHVLHHKPRKLPFSTEVYEKEIVSQRFMEVVERVVATRQSH